MNGNVSPVALGPGTTVLVTGASSGIGAATARLLASRGARVGLVARRQERLQEVLDDCLESSPDSMMWVADLSDPARAAELALGAWDGLGGIDVLVNNAGVPMRRHVTKLTTDEIERVMRVNFHSPVAMTLAILPAMLERRQGTIVNVSSLGGRLGIATEAAYCASKFALAGFSEAMAADLTGTGIRVRLVLPGAVETEIWEQPGNDPPLYEGPKIPAEELAEGIASAIESDAFEHYLPDMRPVVQMKTVDFDAFIEGMLSMNATSSAGGGSPDIVPSPATRDEDAGARGEEAGPGQQPS